MIESGAAVAERQRNKPIEKMGRYELVFLVGPTSKQGVLTYGDDRRQSARLTIGSFKVTVAVVVVCAARTSQRLAGRFGLDLHRISVPVHHGRFADEPAWLLLRIVGQEGRQPTDQRQKRADPVDELDAGVIRQLARGPPRRCPPCRTRSRRTRPRSSPMRPGSELLRIDDDRGKRRRQDQADHHGQNRRPEQVRVRQRQRERTDAENRSPRSRTCGRSDRRSVRRGPCPPPRRRGRRTDRAAPRAPTRGTS